MKLEVGMYVRTKYGIAKIIDFEERKDSDNCYYLDKNIVEEDEYASCCIYDYKYYLEQIVKASNNIIDLIEVGDYVNGIRVTSVHKTVDDNVLIGLGDTFGFSKFDNDYQIKSIVTSQQFESMQYKVD